MSFREKLLTVWKDDADDPLQALSQPRNPIPLLTLRTGRKPVSIATSDSGVNRNGTRCSRSCSTDRCCRCSSLPLYVAIAAFALWSGLCLDHAIRFRSLVYSLHTFTRDITRFSTALPAWGVRRLASIRPVLSRPVAPFQKTPAFAPLFQLPPQLNARKKCQHRETRNDQFPMMKRSDSRLESYRLPSFRFPRPSRSIPHSGAWRGTAGCRISG